MLGLLPWEKIPAYVLGPAMCALCVYLLFEGEHSWFMSWIAEALGVAFGAWMVWHRFSTGREPIPDMAKAIQRR